MPKLIGKCSDVLLTGWVSGYADAVAGPGLLMFLLRPQISLIGMLKDLSGVLMPGQVILLTVALSAGTMCVGRKATVLSGYLL